MSTSKGTYQGIGTGRPKRRRRKGRAKTKRRRRPAPPVMHEVMGIRCRVYEVLLLDQTLVLADEVDGREFEVPLSTLVGRNALANVQKGEAVWLSIRREKPRVRDALGTADFAAHDADEHDDGAGP
jgi:hypothetical protein